ncbi:MFS multidrug transporter-like protein [Xylogone sp. PMI_703]|nr:MFS multidrug transporter-like protein [Xylogone sp. PMI_703]
MVKDDLQDRGKQRPPGFRSAWHEVGFTFSLAMSQILTESFVSGFTVILPGLIQSHIVPESSSIWPASVFSLAVASTTLVFGRLADVYGGRRVYIAGSVWLAIWSIGIGALAVLPSGLILMGTTYRPGTPAGDLITWRAYFWLGAGLAAITSFVSYFTLPRASTTPLGNPYVYTRFTLGICGWIAEYPLIPSYFLRTSQTPVLIFSLFLFYGCLTSTLEVVAWYAPMAVGGCVISIFSGYILHLLPGSCAWITAPLLFAIAPIDATYWSYIFPSMLCATIGIDITFNICNVYMTTSTPHDRQGFSGAVVAFLPHFGGTICLIIW